jgi:hypothetical protein
MDFSSPTVKPEAIPGESFDIQGFKNLLSTLKESKQNQENKAKPVYSIEE